MISELVVGPAVDRRVIVEEREDVRLAAAVAGNDERVDDSVAVGVAPLLDEPILFGDADFVDLLLAGDGQPLNYAGHRVLLYCLCTTKLKPNLYFRES